MRATWKVRWGGWSLLFLMMFVVMHVVTVFVALKYFMPSVWQQQVQAGLMSVALTFLGVSLLNCFLEWCGHRFVLHIPGLDRLKRFYRNHTYHHSLTPVHLRRWPGSNEYYIVSTYDMEEKDDWFNVSFADYTLLVFLLTYTVLVLPFQILFANIPLLLGGYLAVACSYTLYEIFHPLEHRPEGWWQGKLHNPFWRLLKKYSSFLTIFHQYHHMYIRSNMAIVGFFGLPVADIVLGTYKMPVGALFHGRRVYIADLQPPKLNRLVRSLDRRATVKIKYNQKSRT